MKSIFVRYVYVLILFLACIVLTSGKTVTSSPADEQLRLLGLMGDFESPQLTVTLFEPPPSSEPNSIATITNYDLNSNEIGWSPDGQSIHILGHSEDHSKRILRVYDMNTEQLMVLSDTILPNICIVPMVWSSQGRYMAYVEMDTVDDVSFKLYIYDAMDRNTRHITTIDKQQYFPDASAYYARIYWSEENSAFEIHVVAENERIRQAWSVTGESLELPEQDAPNQRSYYGISRVFFSPDRRYAMLRQSNQSIIFDLHRWHLLETRLPANILSVQWSLETGHVVYQWGDYPQVQLAIQNLATSEITEIMEENTRLTGLGGGRWGINNHHVYAQISFPDNIQPHLAIWSLNQARWIYRSDHIVHQVLGDWIDNRYIAYAVQDNENATDAGLYLMDSETWQPVRIIEYPTQPEFYSEFISPDGSHVALHVLNVTGPYTEMLHVINAQTLSVVQVPGQYPLRDPRSTWIRWSPSGQYLVTEPHYGGSTEIVDITDGESYSHSLHTQWDMAFSPNERYLTMHTPYFQDNNSYLLELETQELLEYPNTRFLGWQGGEQDSLFVCPVG